MLAAAVSARVGADVGTLELCALPAVTPVLARDPRTSCAHEASVSDSVNRTQRFAQIHHRHTMARRVASAEEAVAMATATATVGGPRPVAMATRVASAEEAVQKYGQHLATPAAPQAASLVPCTRLLPTPAKTQQQKRHSPSQLTLSFS